MEEAGCYGGIELDRSEGPVKETFQLGALDAAQFRHAVFPAGNL